MTPIEIIEKQQFEKIEELFKNSKPEFAYSQERAINEYKIEKHDIFNKDKRPDKTIWKNSPTGERDADGNPKVVLATVAVARIGLSTQELIVNRRVGFMLSDPVKTDPIFADKENQKEKDLVAFVDRIQNENKMDYKNKEVARRMMSEMECAEIWYFVDNGENVIPRIGMKVKIISPDLGDQLYPLFDNTGNMIAFGRGYKIKEQGTEVEHFDVYTDLFEYKYINKNNKWGLDTEVKSMTVAGETNTNPIPNAAGKIMVVYHSQPKPEWAKVQSSISREEELFSNHADMNDYFGSPILAVAGQIMGFAQKGEQGKILQLNEEAKANYLELSAPPESIKMEMENLDRVNMNMSQTPDISFEKMTDIGGQISGIALKLLFLDAHMAVKNKEEIFGIGLQRRLNLIKACIGNVIDKSFAETAKKLQLKPVITPFLPQNDTEMIDNLTVARTGGIISSETAIEKNPLVADVKVELERIANDKTSELAGQEV